MSTVSGKSPSEQAERILATSFDGDVVKVAIHPPGNPDGGWVIILTKDCWRDFLRSDMATMKGIVPERTDIGVDHGKLIDRQRKQLDALREHVNEKIRHAAPGTDKFIEGYEQSTRCEWEMLAEELRGAGWNVDVGDLHPLYGEGTVTIG